MTTLSQDLPKNFNFSKEDTAKIIGLEICFLFVTYQFFRFMNCMAWQSFLNHFPLTEQPLMLVYLIFMWIKCL